MMPEKHAVMLELLKEAWVHVHLDPRRDGVELPDFLREQPRVVLQYGYNMPVPIHDLTVDERGISATLSFRRVPHATFVPWSAVFALTDGDQHGLVWQDDVPKDLELEQPDLEKAPEAEGKAPAPIRPALRSTASTPGSSRGPGPAGAAKKPRPSHLKLVD